MRSILKRNLPKMINTESTLEIIEQSLADDFMNVIEVACSIRPTTSSSESDSEGTLLGITFLNKHCLVADLAGSTQAGEQEPLLKRTYELKLEIL